MNFKKFISGVSALTIAASAFAGMAVTASAEATTVLNQNFNSIEAGTAVGTEWKNNISGQNGSRSYVTTDRGTSFYHNAGGNGALRIARYLISNDGVVLNNSNVNVSFNVQPRDITNDTSGSVAGSDYSLLDSNGNVIIGVTFKESGISYYTGGASSTVDNSGTGNWGANTNMNSGTLITNSTISNDTWYNVNIAFDYSAGTADLTVIDLATAGETFRKSQPDITVATSAPLKYFHNAVGRIESSGARLTKTTTGTYIDDIVVTKDEVTASEVTVSFSGNASTITVGADTISANETLSLYADTYSYVAKADGYQTEYGTFTVTGSEANAEKEVSITLTAIPAAPTNTNSTVTKVSDNTSFIPAGFRNTGADYASGIDVWPGDKVTIEYDVFVTGGNSFNMALKSAENNGTGANVEIMANDTTVTARNQNSSNNYTTFSGSYPVNQWAHVKISFDAVTSTSATSPETDIRTNNVSVSIKAADGSEITAENITARNLAENFSSGNRSYSFGGVYVSGTANIANAEIYAVGEHTDPTAVATLVKDNIIDDTNYDGNDAGKIFSVYNATVTAGTKAIRNVVFKLNDNEMTTDSWSNGILTSGNAVFALIVPKASTDVNKITAVIDGTEYVALD